MKLSTFVHGMLDLCATGEGVCILDVLSAMNEAGAQTYTPLEVVMDKGDMSEAIIELGEQLTEDQLFHIFNDLKGQ